MKLLDDLRTSTSGLGRRAIGAALGLGLIFTISACSTLPDANADVVAGDAPALWVVRDADSTIYLFGTVHLLRPETVWDSPVVDQAFDSADQIWFEIENPDDQAAAIPLVQRYGIDLETSLSSRLTPGEQTQLNMAAEAMGLNGPAFEPMRPWLAALTLSVAPLTRAGYETDSGVELVLRARALEAGKPITGLETIEEQLQVLSGMSEDAQMAFLRSVLSDYENATVELDRLVAAWAIGDMETLEAIGVTPMRAEGEEFYQALLARRNANWAGQIDTMMQGEGVIFIAVGAAHLAGDDSVQVLLKQRGYTVRRIQ